MREWVDSWWIWYLETSSWVLSPVLFSGPLLITQNKVLIDCLSLELGRQTGWMRGEQEMAFLSVKEDNVMEYEVASMIKQGQSDIF